MIREWPSRNPPPPALTVEEVEVPGAVVVLGGLGRGELLQAGLVLLLFVNE
jgi:hypothetical protein